MNKLAKGSIAGAAGVALLLGGTGTFAYWNDEAGVTGGTIVAGDLKIVNDGAAGVWKDQTGATVDPASYRIVPGDVLTYTDDLTVTAVGKNIAAELTLAGGAITATGGASATAASTALAGYLTSTAVLTATGSGVTAAGANVFDIAEGTGAVTTTVTITFPLDDASTANNNAKLGSVDLSNMAISLVQDH